MNYTTEDLPQSCIDAASPHGNFAVRNARYRTAICEHFQLIWKSVGGTGNCFFESVRTLLRAAHIEEEEISARQLRAHIIDFFRLCIVNRQEPLCERIFIDLEGELQTPLISSTYCKLNGVRINGMSTFC
jgi:hypothetical protein